MFAQCHIHIRHCHLPISFHILGASTKRTRYLLLWTRIFSTASPKTRISCCCSTFISVDDWLQRCSIRSREASVASAGVCHSNGKKNHVTLHTKQRETCSVTLTPVNERIRAEKKEVRDFLLFRGREAFHEEHDARLHVSEMESLTCILREKQKSQVIALARFELLLQQTRAEHSVQGLQRQHRCQDTQHYRSRSQEYIASRQEQALIREGFFSRERSVRDYPAERKNSMRALSLETKE